MIGKSDIPFPAEMPMKQAIQILLLAAVLLALTSCGARRNEVPEPEGETSRPAVPPAAAQEEATLPDAAPEPTPEPLPLVLPDEAERRLALMSPEEKAWQMMMLCSSEPDEVERAAGAGAGGICLYAQSFTGKSPEEVIAMTDALQRAAPIPLLLAVDEEGGTVVRVSINPQLRQSPFASPHTLYEIGGWPLIESDAAVKAELLLSLGLNVNLAPVADTPLSWRNYIYPRCFSTDPEETADYVARVVRVMKAAGIGSSLKHFPGYGGSADTHTGQAFDERPLEDFTEGDFLPFAAGIGAGADSVLVSHNIVACMDGERPASLSPEVHRILREELGFEGVILCDDLEMDAIGMFTGGANAAVAAALAGNDLICCRDTESSVRALTEAMESGLLPMEQVDASVLRILRWKLALGLDLGV